MPVAYVNDRVIPVVGSITGVGGSEEVTPGEEWTPTPLDLELDDLTDVDTTGVADGNILVWDAGSSTWVVSTVATVFAATVAISFVLDGGGGVITSGDKLWVEVPFAGTIVAARLFADTTGSLVVDVRKGAYAGLPSLGSIVASAPPTLSSARKSQDTTLTGWTTAVAAGDWLLASVNSASTITRATLSLSILKT